MKRFSLLSITATACLLVANSFAGGITDKVTGEYTRAGCNGCQPGDVLNFVANRLLSAHEAGGKHHQKGSLFSWNEAGLWFELNFDDTFNTCVNVYEDGRARIGGLVHDGNGPQVGRYFGFYLEDNGEPAYFSDSGASLRISAEYWSESARLYLQHWCQTGNLPGDPLPGYTVWPSIVIAGNLQVHNSNRDGD
jgi:hypothetical protein